MIGAGYYPARVTDVARGGDLDGRRRRRRRRPLRGAEAVRALGDGRVLDLAVAVARGAERRRGGRRAGRRRRPRGRRRRRRDAQRVGPRRAGGGARRRPRSCACTTPPARSPREALFAAVVAAVRAGADGAVPAVPVTDTIKVVDAAGTVVATPDRATLVAVQTPQAFRADVLRRAHAVGRRGHRRRRARRARSADGSSPCPASRGTARSPSPTTSTGPVAGSPAERPRVTRCRSASARGSTSTASATTRPARSSSAACRFPGLPGLVGHSDGDAVAHAVAEALLGAAGLGDIGQHFPDTDPTLAGADSIELLRQVAADVVAERLGDRQRRLLGDLRAAQTGAHARRDAGRLSAAVGAPVTVKGRRPEGLGALGRGEGIACFAVAVLVTGAT